MTRKYRKKEKKQLVAKENLKDKAKRQGLQRHHRLPKSIGGDDYPSNISLVPSSQHRSWHTLFSNHTALTICSIINERWLDRNYRFICIESDKVRKVEEYIKSIS